MDALVHAPKFGLERIPEPTLRGWAMKEATVHLDNLQSFRVLRFPKIPRNASNVSVIEH
jgi:hypothetical protein